MKPYNSSHEPETELELVYRDLKAAQERIKELESVLEHLSDHKSAETCFKLLKAQDEELKQLRAAVHGL
jgi:hypothetical protein